MGKERVKLEGMIINSWYVEEYVGDMKYRCRCKCGNVCDVASKNLKNNISTKCRDCYNRERRDKYIGQMFGHWKVLEYAGDKKQKCMCTKCGRIVNVYTESLVTGMSTQCNSCKSIIRKEDNMLEGLTFGNWYVNKYLDGGMYECICKCGEKRNIIGHNLKIGHTTKCSKCAGKELIDMLDKNIGNLKVIKYNNNGYWLCECSCGRQESIHGYFLRTGQRNMCKTCGNNNTSEAEKYILNLFKDAEGGNRDILNGKEIDIYLPEKKIGIEYNGNFWHSDEYKDRRYHYIKTVEAHRQGIRLIHIFEYEWNDERKRIILENMLKNIDNDTRTKLYACKLDVRIVRDNELKKRFLLDNHIQGDANGDINIGLFDRNELVSIMVIGKPRFDSRDALEMIRYCSKIDKIIVGGAEKLFKYVCNNIKFSKLISYCDIGKFNGKVYDRLGFKSVAISDPNYVWVKGDKVLTRYQTQKKKLIELGLGDTKDSEDSIMKCMGFIKVYDAGNIKFEYDKQ